VNPVQTLLVHYHEIGLKGRNRPTFEAALLRNLRRVTADLAKIDPRVISGRVVARLPEDAPGDAIAERCATVYGVANVALTREIAFDLDGVCRVAAEVMAEQPYETFAVRARVAHSEIGMKVREINEKVGAYLLEHVGGRVNLDDPERTCRIEIVRNRALISATRLQGAGGLPVGVSGKVAVLLSAGIDSPVAAARLMRRGAACEFIHFHSQPFTDGSSVRNVREILQILAARQYDCRLHIVPLAPIQQIVAAQAPEPLRTVLYRRFMVRIAGAIAAKTGAQALVSGDSLGQVASQTLENMAAVEDASPLPVLRPLIGLDKLEIIDSAQQLGTYEASSAPCQDACVLFEPKSPTTRARIPDLRRAEATLDVEAMVQAAVEATEIEFFRFQR
jgi:tRNA uracil 4-sulfurtransferase